MTRIMLTIFAAACISSGSIAQINKGSWLIGGDINAISYKSQDDVYPDSKSTFNGTAVQVSVGRFFKKNQVTGITLGFVTQKDEDFANGTTVNRVKGQGYSFGLFHRRYAPVFGPVMVFGQVGAGYSSSTSEATDFTFPNVAKQKLTGASATLSAGISCKLWKKLYGQLMMPQVLGIGYSKQQNSSNGTNTGSTDYFAFRTDIGANLLSNLGIGLQFIF